MRSLCRPSRGKITSKTASLTYPPGTQDKVVSKLRNTTVPVITCKDCRILENSNIIHSSFLEKSLNGHIGCCTSCLTDNVVYIINCLKYKSQYMGETKRCIKARMYEHLSTIEHFRPGKQSTPVTQHFKMFCQTC